MQNSSMMLSSIINFLVISSNQFKSCKVAIVVNLNNRSKLWWYETYRQEFLFHIKNSSLMTLGESTSKASVLSPNRSWLTTRLIIWTIQCKWRYCWLKPYTHLAFPYRCHSKHFPIWSNQACLLNISANIDANVCLPCSRPNRKLRYLSMVSRSLQLFRWWRTCS